MMLYVIVLVNLCIFLHISQKIISCCIVSGETTTIEQQSPLLLQRGQNQLLHHWRKLDSTSGSIFLNFSSHFSTQVPCRALLFNSKSDKPKWIKCNSSAGSGKGSSKSKTPYICPDTAFSKPPPAANETFNKLQAYKFTSQLVGFPVRWCPVSLNELQGQDWLYCVCARDKRLVKTKKPTLPAKTKKPHGEYESYVSDGNDDNDKNSNPTQNPTKRRKTKKPTKPDPSKTLTPTESKTTETPTSKPSEPESQKPTNSPSLKPTIKPSEKPTLTDSPTIPITISPTSPVTSASNKVEEKHRRSGGSFGDDLLGAFLVFLVTGVLLYISYKFYGPGRGSSRIGIASPNEQQQLPNIRYSAARQTTTTNNQDPIALDSDFNPSQGI